MRRNYRNAFHALYKVVSEESIFTLWKGALPTIIRAGVINLAMLTPYEECKERVSKYFGETKCTMLLSSALAGVISSFCSLPFDNMKTKL